MDTMYTVYIVRHAEALPDGELSPSGTRQSSNLADRLEKHIDTPPIIRIFCSPKKRASQTAEVIAGRFRELETPPIVMMSERVELDEDASPETIRSFLSWVSSREGVKIIVSHLPVIETIGKLLLIDKFVPAVSLEYLHNGEAWVADQDARTIERLV